MALAKIRETERERGRYNHNEKVKIVLGGGGAEKIFKETIKGFIRIILRVHRGLDSNPDTLGCCGATTVTTLFIDL